MKPRTETTETAETRTTEPLTRRAFFTRTATAGALTVAAGLLVGAGCGKSHDGPQCDGTSGLSLADKQTRTVNKYVDVSPMKDKNCLNCALYVPAPAGVECGGCTVVKGTISPLGYCIVWAPKPA